MKIGLRTSATLLLSTLCGCSAQVEGGSAELGSKAEAVTLECQAAPWQAAVTYEDVGLEVTHEGALYRSRWWNVGAVPSGIAGNAWELIGPCSGEPVLPACTAAAWDSKRIYSEAASEVVFDGARYVNRDWSFAQQPDISSGSKGPWKWVGACEGPGTTTVLACEGSIWSASRGYEQPGTRVVHQGELFESRWWAAGIEPVSNPNNPWLYLGPCEGEIAVAACVAPEWNSSLVYASAGNTVTYEGNTYVNKWYTRSAPLGNGFDAWRWLGECTEGSLSCEGTSFLCTTEVFGSECCDGGPPGSYRPAEKCAPDSGCVPYESCGFWEQICAGRSADGTKSVLCCQAMLGERCEQTAQADGSVQAACITP